MVPKTLTAEERPIYEGYLTKAETAYHKLIAGAQAASVSYNGESVTYRSANIAQLKSYINDLRRALGKSLLQNPGVALKPVVFGRRLGGGGHF